MGRKEWARQDDRERALALVREGRPLTAEEITVVKQCYSGIGGLVASGWGGGSFFTPPTVVSFVQELVQLRENSGAILEASCGSGSFFENVDPRRCTGIEQSVESYTIARACYPEARIIRSEAEQFFPYGKGGEFDGAFQYVLGNPPFGLKKRWQGEMTAGREQTILSEWIFLEIAFRAVKPGGAIAMIVPDGLLANRASHYLRKWLMGRCFIRAVISLPTETFYHASTSVKTSVLYLQRFPVGVTKEMVGDYRIFMAIVEDIGWDSRGRATGKCDLKKVLDTYLAFRDGNEDIVDLVQPEFPDPTTEPLPVLPLEEATPANVEPQNKCFIQMALF
ncbi:MAG: hypothetical protein C0402_05465 [Thermodesulfovibrio sp.]|nr:hypothetical protein [Thermodesulfovibrio sp.]